MNVNGDVTKQINPANLTFDLNSLHTQNLDLTKKKMVHEGPLSWKVNKDKTIGTLTTSSGVYVDK